MHTSSRTRRTTALAAVLLIALPLAAAQVPAFNLSQIETIFSFGDSWTTTGYTPSEGISSNNRTQTTSGGYSWVQYLAQNYTGAADSYYDLADSGATIDTEVVYSNGAGDFESQTGEFLAYFNTTTSTVQWDSDTTLFTVFFGNEDIYNCFVNGWNYIEAQPRMLTSYDKQIERLYQAGARKFLLISLPSLDRTPLALSIAKAPETIESAIEYWNDRLAIYAAYLEAKYAGVQTKYFSSREFTADILDKPQDNGFTLATTACPAYAAVEFEPEATNATCIFSLATYFWKDIWHPTWRVHEMMASRIATLLSSDTPTLVFPNSTSSVLPSSAIANLSTISAATSTATVPVSTGLPLTTTLTATATATTTETETVSQSTSSSRSGFVVGFNTSGASSSASVPRRGVVGAVVLAAVLSLLTLV